MRSLFNQDAPIQSRLPLSAAPKPRRQFIDQYRPSCLDELHGQEPIVASLRAFCANPVSTAFMFHGLTGIGKTSAAFALCGELGVDLGSNWYYIRSGTADAETAEQIIDGFRFAPWGRDDAWRIVLVDEADKATPKAKQLWLSMLECLPERTIIIFTTNEIDRFDQRTLDRFKAFKFLADDLAGAQAAVDMVWTAETGGTDGPSIGQLPNVVINGEVSIRRAIQSLEAVIRDGAVLLPPPVPVFLEETNDECAQISNDGRSEAGREDVAGLPILPCGEREANDLDHVASGSESSVLGSLSSMRNDRSSTADNAGSGEGLESLGRDTYVDGRTMPIPGDDVHTLIADDWRVKGRVIERDGQPMVKLETGDVLPLDEEWSVVGEGMDDGDSIGREVLDCDSGRSEPRGNNQKHHQSGTVRQMVRDQSHQTETDGQDLLGVHGNLGRVPSQAPTQAISEPNAIDVLTPSGIFLAPISGGSPEAGPSAEITIKGDRYTVTPTCLDHTGKSYRLMKQNNGGSVYDVTQERTRTTCNCPGYKYYHEKLEGQSKGCRHIKILVTLGMLDRRYETRSAAVAPSDLALPAEPEPISDELAAKFVRQDAHCRAVSLGRAIASVDRGPDRRVSERRDTPQESLTLAELIERESLRLAAMGSDAGTLMARTLLTLAEDVRAQQATTVADYEARVELQERWLTEAS